MKKRDREGAIPMKHRDEPAEKLSGELRRSQVKVTYTHVLDQVFRSVVAENGELDRQRATVPTLVSELTTLTPNQRKLLIRNSSRYQVWPLAEDLLDKCRRHWSENPSHAEEYAAVALEVASSIPARGFRRALLHDLKAEIWSHIANCRRIQSDLYGAQEAFGRAEGHLIQGSGDPPERARFLDLKSSLLRAQRKFEAAAESLAEAIQLYRFSSDRHSEGRALVKQAKLLADSGKPEEAVPLLERAAEMIDARREPRLMLLLKMNLGWHLQEASRPEEAKASLPEVREMARQYGTRHDRLRVLWLEGVIRSSLGQPELAEEVLKQVREGFIAAEIGYDAALVSLNLAVLYLETGRTAEVRQLAADTLPVFGSLNVQREFLMAWRLFQEAAERDMATIHLINEVATLIRGGSSAAAPDRAS